MLCSRQVALAVRRVALGTPLLASVACGRLGFSELASDVRGTARAHDAATDAGAPSTPAAEDASVLFAFDPLDASLDASTPDAGSPGDAGRGTDAGRSDAGSPPPPPATDPACNDSFHRRLWPAASDVQSCVTSYGVALPSTGPGSADYTVYNGCSTWLDFDTQAGSRIQIRAFGDGCVCTDCSLWHVHYQLQEDLGSGLTPELEFQAPDDTPCAGGVEVDTYTSFTPATARVRLQALSGSTGSGFYFVLCGAP